MISFPFLVRLVNVTMNKKANSRTRFQFAIMFGDVGHGTLMFLAALYFILKEKRLEAARIRDEVCKASILPSH